MTRMKNLVTLMRAKYWHYVDELQSLEKICQSPEGKATYRQGWLVWKTKALILDDHLSKHARNIRRPSK